jgi:hypothetical protein
VAFVMAVVTVNHLEKTLDGGVLRQFLNLQLNLFCIVSQITWE